MSASFLPTEAKVPVGPIRRCIDEEPTSSFLNIYKSLSYKPLCPNVENPLTFESVHSDLFALTKVHIDDSYSKKLTSEQQQTKKMRAIEILQEFASDAETEDRINAVLNSENFKIEIVESFPDAPTGVFAGGVFRTKRNVVQILIPHSDPSNMAAPTLTHEFYGHASIATLRSHGLTATIAKQTENIDVPFETVEEQQALQKGINEGDQFIVKDFREMHTRALKNRLTDLEKRSYNSLVSTLAEYQPRHVVEFFYVPAELQDGEISRLKALGKIRLNPHQQTLYIQNIVKDKNGLIVEGNFVKNISDKVSAFICDTNHRIMMQRAAYRKAPESSNSKEFEQLMTTESYAEIVADPRSIVEAFHPKVAEYDRKFTRKINCQKFTDKDDEITNSYRLTS